jgi:pyrroline-5-carboxylate reductase
MPAPYTIALAGCGKMGAAMGRAWLAGGLAEHLYVIDPNGLPPEWALDDRITYCASDAVFLGHAARFDILVIAIKPQDVDALCASLKTHLPQSLPVLSIAAGKPVAAYQNHFGQAQPIIRAMPNTPAAIGKGITVACAAPSVSGDVKDMADMLLNALGLNAWVSDEGVFDAVTAVSGSGPAYLFYLIECLMQAGIAVGLEPAFAEKLARQTVIGAAALAEEMRDVPAAILRENVTSPGGTTAAALSVLMDGRFQQLMTEAVLKAAARSKELSR